MKTRLNADTTAITNDYIKKLRDEIKSNNQRIQDLMVFISPLKTYEVEFDLLKERNEAIDRVIDSIDCNIMKPVDETKVVLGNVNTHIGIMPRFEMQVAKLPNGAVAV